MTLNDKENHTLVEQRGDIHYTDTPVHKHLNQEDPVPFINQTSAMPQICCINPKKTKQNKNRIRVQRSVFVYAVDGFIPIEETKHLAYWTISASAKYKILTELKQHHNITHETIYNDLIGFIASERNFHKTLQYHIKGHAKLSEGDYDAAIIEYNRAISMNPLDAMPFISRGLAYNQHGSEYHDQTSYTHAIKDFSEAIHLAPKIQRTYHFRGLTKMLQNKHKEAIIDFEQAKAIDPNDEKIYYLIGNCKLFIGDYTGAKIELDRAIAINNRYKYAYLTRAEVKRRMQDYTGAMEDVNRAIAIDSNFTKAYELLKKIELQRKQH